MFVRAQLMRNGEQELARAGAGLLAAPRVTVDATDGNITLTTAMILGGVISHTVGAARTDTTATAALLIAAMPGMDIGDTYMFIVSSPAAFAITVAGGTDVTGSGNLVVAASTAKHFVLVKTSATTMDLIGL